MPSPHPILRRLTDALLWLQGTLLSRTLTTGGLTGRRDREQALIHRLLATYPALAYRPYSDLYDVSTRVFGALSRPRLFVTFLAVQVVTFFLTFSLLEFSLRWDVPIPRVARIVIPFVAATATAEFARRRQIRRELDRAIVAVFPTLFCPCGYCLLGLPPDSPCPECGTARTPTPPLLGLPQNPV